ncbi:MAG: hypothetical protein WAK53_15370 [Chromatiaceae bacterium]|jgi:hypothetical protein
MTYTPADLEALQQALISGEQRVSFGDKTVKRRSVADLQAAIRTVAAALARDQGTAPARQIRVTTSKGF